MVYDLEIKDASYRFHFVASNHERLENIYYGRVDLYSKEFWIDIDYQSIRRVLIHEITHAVVFEYGFKGAKWNEEALCEFMEAYGPEIVRIADGVYDALGNLQRGLK